MSASMRARRRADWRFFVGMAILSPLAGVPWLLLSGPIPAMIQVAAIIVFAFVVALQMIDDESASAK